jgi:D-cysteine desulfhydrase
VLTFGGVGSNHALATAVHARRVGLGCHLVLLPEPPSEHARSHLLAEHHLGARLHAGRRPDLSDLEAARERHAPSEAPYVIPPGGTSALGNVGYVNAGFELAAQVAAGRLPEPDAVYAAAGTTGTAAGLYVGLRAAGLSSRLVAVRASSRGTATRARLEAEVVATVALLRRHDPSFPPVRVEDGRLELEHRFAGRGYAQPSRAGEAARRVAARHGIELDPTYTAKAFAALRARGRAHAGEVVLFWNTFDPREVGHGEVSPGDLPGPFRAYFRG